MITKGIIIKSKDMKFVLGHIVDVVLVVTYLLLKLNQQKYDHMLHDLDSLSPSFVRA